MTDNIQNGEGVERLPCPNPWCKTHEADSGGVPFVAPMAGLPRRFQMVCPYCPMRGPTGSKVGCVTAWNTRHSLAREPATADVEQEVYWKALEQAARDLGGAGTHLIGKRQSNLWLDIAFKAHTALSRAAPSSEPAIAEVERLRGELRRIAEGNLGDQPWQANYDRIRAVAVEALAQSSTPPASKGVEGPTQRQIIDAIHTALPRSRWSCSDDESGTTLSLARQRKYSVDAVKALYAASPTPSNDTLQGRGEWLCVGCEGKPAPENNPCAVCGKDTRHDG